MSSKTKTKTAPTSREDWLNAFITESRAVFKQHGMPLPAKIRAAIGFTSKGSRGKRIGECWSDSASADGTFEVFIVPSIMDSRRVADILTHELCHAAAGIEAGHKGPFFKIARALGLEGKLTATVGGPAFYAWADPILDRLGPIPHATLGANAVSTSPRKQTTRMLKVSCGECGFTFRVARSWLDKTDHLMCPANSCGFECTVG